MLWAMGQALLGYGIAIGGILLGTVALGIVAGVATVLCHALIIGWHGTVWIAQTPRRRRERRELDAHRWRTWRPKRDLRHLPH